MLHIKVPLNNKAKETFIVLLNQLVHLPTKLLLLRNLILLNAN